MKKYLVTGGAGFIGSNFIEFMFEKYREDIQIINLDALTYAGNKDNLKEVEERENYIFIQGDIRDYELLDQLFKKYSFDRVVHFAAETHVDRSITEPNAFVTTNIIGTVNLLNAAKKYWKAEDSFLENKRYLQVSTDEVYGALGEEGYFYETTPLNPHSPYSASKASADLMVKSYIDTYHFPANITRCSNNYGAKQFPEKLIPLIIYNALNRKELPVYGDGRNIRDWLYVKDHAKALDLVMEQGKVGEVYNIGGHNEKRNIEIVKLILQSLQEMLPESYIGKEQITEKLIQYVEDRKGHDWRYAIAPDKIKKEIGWEPETSFEKGIRFTIDWYLSHPDWMERVTSGAYQEYYEKMYNKK